MEKAINKLGNVHFMPTVPTYKAPAIAETIVNDEGDEVYILENGNTSLKSRYDAIWNPIAGKVNMKGRGETIESKQRRY